jgi:hypothetical protein
VLFFVSFCFLNYHRKRREIWKNKNEMKSKMIKEELEIETERGKVLVYHPEQLSDSWYSSLLGSFSDDEDGATEESLMNV